MDLWDYIHSDILYSYASLCPSGSLGDWKSQAADSGGNSPVWGFSEGGQKQRVWKHVPHVSWGRRRNLVLIWPGCCTGPCLPFNISSRSLLRAFCRPSWVRSPCTAGWSHAIEVSTKGAGEAAPVGGVDGNGRLNEGSFWQNLQTGIHRLFLIKEQIFCPFAMDGSC